MKYAKFMKHVQAQAHLDSVVDAVKATRAALETLGERLPADERKHLAAQLPSEMAFYVSGIPASSDKFGLDEFFKRVSQREGTPAMNAINHAKAVMSVLQSAVTEGEINDIRSQLPDEFSRLFPAANRGNMKKAA